MSLFDELAKLFFKVQPLGDAPYQIIYAVDDAWFHPQYSKVEIKDKDDDPPKFSDPVFDFDLAGKTVPIDRDTLKQPSGNTDSEQPPDYSEYIKQALSKTGADRDVVEELFRFMLDQQQNNDRRYGICFCSFEWFWRNMHDIDQPQNAVFFDIRHLLGRDGSIIKRAGSELDVGQLRDDWKTALEGIDLFSEIAPPFHMERLGWHLHYCLKFAKVPGQAGSRPAIADNHIQIVSSAVNPGSGRPDAMSDYSQVQGFIWAKLAPLGGTPVDDITPDRFTFSPMPKVAAMTTGLAIFNNSFKHAADWEKIQALLAKDIVAIYGADKSGHLEESQANALPLSWKGWIPAERNEALRPIYHKTAGFYNLDINILLDFLKHTGISYFPRNWTGFDKWKVALPTTPGILFVYGLADLMNKLPPMDGRKPPTVSYRLESAATSNYFVVEIRLENGGASDLYCNYESGKKRGKDVEDGASLALLRVGKWKKDSVNHSLLPNCNLGKITLGDANFQDNYPEITLQNSSVVIKLQATQAAAP